MSSDILYREFKKQLDVEVEHNRLSPSASGCWTVCTAMPDAKASLPEEYTAETSESAAKGTVLHAMACALLVLRFEKKVIEYLSIDASFLGTGHTYRGHSFTIKSDDLAKVKSYVAYVSRLATHPDFKGIELEKHVDILGITSGYIDAIVWIGNDIHIIDLKTGWHLVDPEENDQLTLYGLSQIEEGFENIHITIHQDCEATTWTISHGQLAARAKKFLDAADKIANDPEFKPGVWCKKNYCPFVPKCQAVIDAITPAIKGETELTIAEKLELAELAEAFAKGVKGEAFRALEKNAGAVEGWQISLRNGHRKWKSEKAMIEALPESVRPFAYSKDVLSPAALETKLEELADIGIDVSVDIKSLVKQDKSKTLKRLKKGETPKNVNAELFADLL